MSYWGTSAMVKLFTAESDSARFHAYAGAAASPLITAEFTRLEFWTALRRKEAERLVGRGEAKRLLADFDSDVAQGEYEILPVSSMVRAEFESVIDRCFSQTPPVFIRTLDALHIAAARAVGEAEIVATDRRLRDAATMLGFQLFPPPMP